MNVEYCPSCGAKNFFEINRPQFCCQCRHEMSKMHSNASNRNIGAVRSNNYSNDFDIDDPDGEDIYEVPNISKLEYSIDLSSMKSKKNSLQSLVNQSNGHQEVERVPRRIPPKTRENADPIAESIKECGPSKGPIDIS